MDFEQQKDLWKNVIDSLRPKVEPQEFFYLEKASFSKVQDELILLTVENQFIKDFINERFGSRILDLAQEYFSDVSKLKIEIAENQTPPLQPSDTAAKAEHSNKITDAPHIYFEKTSEPAKKTEKKPPHPGLDETFTFDSFISNDINSYTHQVAQAVAKDPGTAYNPLFIYGDVGLGKTHLLQAIGNYLHAHSDKKVFFTTAEAFTSDFIDTLRAKGMANFRKKYRQSIDILLIDDIHFFKKNMMDTQEEFFNTLNALLSSKKQMVFTCDRPAAELKELSTRLSSRLGMGLEVSLQMPPFETRCAILKKIAENANIDVPNEVIELTSKKISSNVRDLIATFNKIKSYSEVLKKPITLQVAQDLLKDSFASSKQTNISIEVIQKITADYFSIPLKELKGKGRKQSVSHARHIAMFLVKTMTECSFTESGEYFEREHSTVLHAVEKIKKMVVLDPQIDNTIQELTRLIKENTSK